MVPKFSNVMTAGPVGIDSTPPVSNVNVFVAGSTANTLKAVGPPEELVSVLDELDEDPDGNALPLVPGAAFLSAAQAAHASIASSTSAIFGIHLGIVVRV
jgi:hypothetical protein